MKIINFVADNLRRENFEGKILVWENIKNIARNILKT